MKDFTCVPFSQEEITNPPYSYLVEEARTLLRLSSVILKK